MMAPPCSPLWDWCQSPSMCMDSCATSVSWSPTTVFPNKKWGKGGLSLREGEGEYRGGGGLGLGHLDEIWEWR